MKLLRTIRFDMSDDHVFDIAAGSDEWAISGVFAYAGVEKSAVTGKLKQGFSNGFLGIPSFGRSTFATVSDATAEDADRIIENLTIHLIEVYKAPDENAARAVAREELTFVQELCADALINTVFTVRRTFDDDDQIREAFRTIQPPTDKPLHSRIWSVVHDDE